MVEVLACFHVRSSKAQLIELSLCTVLGRERGTDGELLSLKTLPELTFTWSSEKYFRYRNSESALAHSRGEVPSPDVNDPGAPAISPDYYVDVERRAEGDFADLFAAAKPPEHTVLKIKATDLHDACRYVDVAEPSSKIDVVDYALGLVSVSAPGGTSSNSGVQRTTEVFELQIKYDHLAG